MRGVRRPLVSQIWVVTVENEGLLTNSFLSEREARRHLELVTRRHSKVRIDLAKYQVIGDTWEVVRSAEGG